MVVEMRLHTATKGTAINDFLQEEPFKGRLPFFAGDDVTDEDAFTAVNALGGITVKVGPGETQRALAQPASMSFLPGFWRRLNARRN